MVGSEQAMQSEAVLHSGCCKIVGSGRDNGFTRSLQSGCHHRRLLGPPVKSSHPGHCRLRSLLPKYCQKVSPSRASHYPLRKLSFCELRKELSPYYLPTMVLNQSRTVQYGTKLMQEDVWPMVDNACASHMLVVTLLISTGGGNIESRGGLTNGQQSRCRQLISMGALQGEDWPMVNGGRCWAHSVNGRRTCGARSRLGGKFFDHSPLVSLDIVCQAGCRQSLAFVQQQDQGF